MYTNLQLPWISSFLIKWTQIYGCHELFLNCFIQGLVGFTILSQSKLILYITDLVCYTNFHWFFIHECQHIFAKQMGYIFQSLNVCLLWCSSRYGTAMEHRSLLNRSGICDGIICCNIFLFFIGSSSMNVSIYLQNRWGIYFSLPKTITTWTTKITLHWINSIICQMFSRLNVCLLWCSSRYGTAMEHRSLLNRSGICDGIICCNIFLFMQPFWV
jgi:hypothetical protein